MACVQGRLLNIRVVGKHAHILRRTLGHRMPNCTPGDMRYSKTRTVPPTTLSTSFLSSISVPGIVHTHPRPLAYFPSLLYLGYVFKGLVHTLPREAT
jgi:hypothetical protein